MEYIDTSSRLQPKSAQQPAEEKRKLTGQLRVQIVEETKDEAFMTAKVNDPETRRVQMAEQMRKSKRQELISKKRQSRIPDQFR